MNGNDIIKHVKEWKEVYRNKTPLVASVKHVSKSGMLRVVSFALMTLDGDFLDLDWIVADELGKKINRKHNGLNFTGCGYNVKFEYWYIFINHMHKKAPELLTESEWKEYEQMGSYAHRM